MALSSQRLNLLPVGDEFIFLQVDLGSVLRMGLLQALGVPTQSVHLVDSRKRVSKAWEC